MEAWWVPRKLLVFGLIGRLERLSSPAAAKYGMSSNEIDEHSNKTLA